MRDEPNVVLKCLTIY